MDINQFFRVAESKGLEAINAIRSSRASVAVPQMSRLTPRPEDVMSVRPTGPQITRVTPRPEQVMSRVSVAFTQPAIKPLITPLYTSMASIKFQPTVTPPQPTVSKIELDPNKIEEERLKIIQEFGERVKYNWNKLSNELGDFLQKNVGPAIAKSVEANAALDKKIIEKASEGKLNELTPEDFEKAARAEAQATAVGGIGTLQAVGLPTEAIIQRSIIQPPFQNWKLDQAEKLGVVVTPEQRRAANLGDLNLSFNDILKKQKIEINDTMSEQEKKIIEQANSDFFWREVLDTSVSLIDIDTIYGIAKLPKAVKSLSVAVKLDNINQVINDISRFAAKGDKESIEKTIGRKLTDVESNRIDEIAKNPEAKNADKVVGKAQGAKIDENLKDAENFNKELNAARELASGKKKSIGERVKDIWTNYKTLFESSTDEFFDLVNKIEKQIGEIKPSDNPLYFFDALYKSARQAEMFAKDNGFVDILKKASQLSDARTAEEFGNYLFKRRELKLKDAIGKKVTDEKRTRNFLNQYSKKYAELAKEYDVYMNKVITYAQKNGLISTEEYNRLTQLEDYTPFYKIFDMTKKPEPVVLAKKRVGGVGGPINQKIKTVEEQTYENPVIASLYYTYKVIDQVNKNKFSSKIGELVRQGLIEDASIAVDAANVIRRNNLLQDIKELKKVQDRVTNVLTKKNVQWKMVAKELNALAKRGMNISLNMKDAPVDNAFLRRVEKKINDRLQKKQNLLQEIDDLNEAGLDFAYINMDNEQVNRDLEITNKFTEKFTKKILAKQEQIEELTNDINDLNVQGLNIKLSSGQETLSQSGFNTRLREKLQNKIIKKEELIEDLLNSTDETVRNRLNKYLSNISGEKYTKKKNRLEFYKSLTEDELDDLMYKIYDLNVNEFKKFKGKFKTVARNKAEYTDLISEIDTLKTRQATNNLTNSLIQMTPKQLAEVYTKIGKKNKKIKDLMGDIKDLSDARLTNFLTNKLIKANPQELDGIKAAIKSKESDLYKTIEDVENLSTNRYYNALVTSLIKKTPEQIEALKPELKFVRKENKKKAAVLEDITNTILDAQKIKEETTAGIQTRQAEEKLLRDADTSGQSTISWYKDGIKETAIVPKQLADSLTIPNDVGVLDEVVRLATLPTKYWKETIVGGNPVSQARQFYKDQELLIFTTIPRMGFSVANPVTFFKGMFGAAAETPEFRKYLRLGGGGTSYDIYGGKQSVEEFVKKGAKTKKVSWENWKKLIGKGEEASRYQIYLGAKEFYLKRGFSVEDAEIRAVYDANNLLPNFFKKGKISKALEAAVPFVSAKIAGARVVRELFALNPFMASLYVLGRVAIPMGALTYWNMSSPERAEAYADIPEYEKERGPIILPEVPVRNKDGKWDYISPPGDESIMSLSNGYRRGFEALMKSDEKAMADRFRNFFSDEGIDIPRTGKDIIEATTGQEIPLSVREFEQQVAGANPYVMGVTQGLFNKNLFTGQQIETNEDLRRLPKDRFDDKTTLLAKDLGQTYNVSPKTVDFYMNNYMPGMLAYARFTLDETRQAFKNDPREVVGRSMLQDFEKIIKRSSGGASEAKIRETLKEEEQVKGSKKLILEEAIKNNDFNMVKQLSNEFTLQEVRALENKIQTEKVKETLVGPQRNLFTLSNAELDKVAEKYPRYQNDINTVKELKKIISKEPNINFANEGITFKSTGGGGGAAKITAVKVGKIKKPRKIRIKGPAKPKKIKVSKPKQIKRPKLVKIKPLKKFRRV